MDPVSRLLSAMDVSTAGPARLEASGTWALQYAAAPDVRLGQLVRGETWVRVDDGTGSRRLAAGDCFVVVTGDPFVLSAGPDVAPGDGDAVCNTSVDGVARIGEGSETCVEGGVIGLDPASQRLLRGLLPPLVVIGAADSEALGVAEALERFFDECRSSLPGATLAAISLARLVCLAAIRTSLAASDATAGYLEALIDPVLGGPLRAVHEEPARDWTVTELADLAHLSRSAFTRRFREVTGEAPSTHVLAVRMRLAAQSLLRSDRTIASIGEELGYSSEASFSRAFKRSTGVAPRRWQAERRAGNRSDLVVVD